MLKPELAAIVGAERFLAEIRTTANLRHPHILPLFDSGEADGQLVPEPVRRGIVSLQSGDQVWGRDESTRRFLVSRTGQTGFPQSELEVVTNWRRTVVEALSESGR